MMIDKHLKSFLDDYFKNENKVRCIILYINSVIHLVYWDEIGKYITGPEKFIDDVYELIASYNVDKECIVFIDNNDERYLMRLQKI
ncbi:MAG: hypothetical protein R3321_04565 [Nitrososphaeraceae archaeon]|nr:hypothetical protein [Nitrososphaeraceae archaeon]